MRILITGGHSELIWDMVKVFHEKLGHNVEISGGYPDDKRPSITKINNREIELSEKIWAVLLEYSNLFGSFQDINAVSGKLKDVPSISDFLNQDHWHAVEEIVDGFDYVYCFIPALADIFSQKSKVLWHLIGGENIEHKNLINKVIKRGSKVVCYSESQERIFSKSNLSLPTIHFYKDSEELNGWVGSDSSVLYLANDILSRKEACHYNWFVKTRIEDKWWLAGSINEQCGSGAVKFSYEELISRMRKTRLFFNLGTDPAPYTLGLIEAAMVGMPIVTPNYIHHPSRPQYQVPELFKDSCFVLNNNKTIAKASIRFLLKKKSKCNSLSEASRSVAIREFGDSVLEKWKELL